MLKSAEGLVAKTKTNERNRIGLTDKDFIDETEVAFGLVKIREHRIETKRIAHINNNH